MLVFKEEGEGGGGGIGKPGEKPLRSRVKYQQQTLPTYGHESRIEAGPHWWEASAITFTGVPPSLASFADDLRASSRVLPPLTSAETKQKQKKNTSVRGLPTNQGPFSSFG